MKKLSRKKKVKIPSTQKLASEIAKREGGKSQARIGDIRQILKIIIELEAEAMINEKLQDKWSTLPSDVINENANKKYRELSKKALKSLLAK